MSKVQNVHHFPLSDEKDRDKRIVRAGLQGEEKKLHEKMEKRGRYKSQQNQKFPRGKEPGLERLIIKGPRREEMA